MVSGCESIPPSTNLMTVAVSTKRCASCSQPLPLTAFYKDKRKPDGCYSSCAKCFNDYKKSNRHRWADRERTTARRYYEENRDWVLSKAKQRYQLHPEKKRDEKLRRKYGISLAEWNLLFDSQGRKCAICRRDHSLGFNGSWHLDHNHQTNKIRKILCHACNTALGMVRDSVNILQKMIAYLQEHS